eukprot:4579286-Lingulodinium_polyedra.AAC.1
MERAKRAICEPLRRRTVDSTESLPTVFETVHNGAVESTVCRHNNSQIARVAQSMRMPILAFRMERTRR